MFMDDSAAQIDRFIDALWIEDGLSAQTLAAYRRDLSAVRAVAAAQQGRDLERRANRTCWPTWPSAMPPRAPPPPTGG